MLKEGGGTPMNPKDTGLAIIVASIVFAVMLLLGAYLIPWHSVSWGKMAFIAGETITVVGEAKSKQKTQVSSFTAGVNGVGDDKQAVIADVNKKTQALIDAAKGFGIPADDIKTDNLSIYQSEETYYEDGRQKARPGQWRVGNSVTVKLRDVDRAAALTDALSKAGATNMYGPNFALDETSDAENALIADAMKDARAKAELMAKAAGRTLKRVTNVVEGYQPQPVFYRESGGGGGGGAGLEPGSGTVTTTLTVTYELK